MEELIDSVWDDINEPDVIVRNVLHSRFDGKLVIEKAVLTVHGASSEESFVKAAVLLELLTGRAPQVLLAKKSISKYRLREGDLEQVKVTLRGSQLESFLTNRVVIGLPSLRDFEPFVKVPSDGTWNFTFPSLAAFFSKSEVFRNEPDRQRPPMHLQLVAPSLKKVYGYSKRWYGKQAVKSKKTVTQFQRSKVEQTHLDEVSFTERSALMKRIVSGIFPCKRLKRNEK